MTMALELIGVSKSYGARRALDDVTLDLPAGSALGLLGPNGAGKTTTLRLLLGLCRADTGHVLLQSHDPAEPASRRGVGYLPERLVLPPHMKLEAFLTLHGRLAGLEGQRLDFELDAVFEQTGLSDRRQERIGSLSKGLAQRLGFAQALLGEPKLLLLDEPSSGLDPIGMRDARLWVAAARERGCSVLISSHLLSEVERLCDRVAILYEGRVAAAGAIEEIVAEGEELEDAFMRLISSGGSSRAD
jgi:ABC-2 type transport system ATP-binding protein